MGYVSASIGTPLSAATSINTPRVMSVPTCSTPSLVKPVRVATSPTLTQLYRLSPMV